MMDNMSIYETKTKMPPTDAADADGAKIMKNEAETSMAMNETKVKKPADCNLNDHCLVECTDS